ncbi:WD40 repeat domain-containing protein [Kamptonema formosum]|uniref:WD40 repeat domain-containing protein n=1 Tax=Kamptonema formosum TaxID=331992 RepID=UPI00036DC264|nr:WD40 repeat domain-containing protein [Oscillatoria sp. PCC 10802]
MPRRRNFFRNRLALWGAVAAAAAAPATKMAMSATRTLNGTLNAAARVNPQLILTLERHKGTVEALAFSPDGKIKNSPLSPKWERGWG